MPKFRKKPVVIEAMQFTREPNATMRDFLRNCDWDISVDFKKLKIQTLEGVMIADVGDWIIQGVKGEFYPCKPDIFEQTYEPA